MEPILTPQEASHRVVVFFEQLQPSHLQAIGILYAADATFKDPFNEVRGVPAIHKIFAHMFDTLIEPRFVVHTRVLEGSNCFLTWDFHFGLTRLHAGTPQVVHGASHLVFDDRGRVCAHRDYWDAAEELYEKLPVLGGLMRWLKAQVQP